MNNRLTSANTLECASLCCSRAMLSVCCKHGMHKPLPDLLRSERGHPLGGWRNLAGVRLIGAGWLSAGLRLFRYVIRAVQLSGCNLTMIDY